MIDNHAVRKAAYNIPRLEIEHELSPITRTIVRDPQRPHGLHCIRYNLITLQIRVTLTITPDFSWNDRFHGGAEPFWIWVTVRVAIGYSEKSDIGKRVEFVLRWW